MAGEARRSRPRPTALHRALPPRQPKRPIPGRPFSSLGSSTSGTGMKPKRTHTRSRLCGLVKTVSIFSLSAQARASETRPAAASTADSGSAPGGLATAGPCSSTVRPARSSRRAPTSASSCHAPQPALTSPDGGAQAPTKLKSSRASRPGSSRGRKARPSQVLLLSKHRVLQTLGQAELHHALGRDLDRLARLRVASHAGFAIGEPQTPEVRQHEDVLGFLDGESFELLEEVHDLLLREAALLGEVGDGGG